MNLFFRSDSRGGCRYVFFLAGGDGGLGGGFGDCGQL